jgi:hypothetical protein
MGCAAGAELPEKYELQRLKKMKNEISKRG